MRRIVFGLVIALVGAGFAGRLTGTSAIQLNGATVSAPQLRAELAVIATHPDFDCYLGPDLGTPIVVTTTRVAAVTAAEWTTHQVEGVAAVQFVDTHDHWTATAAALANAQVDFASYVTSLVANYEISCPTSAVQAITELPSWFRTMVLTQVAASAYYSAHLSGLIVTTPAGLSRFYRSNPSDFDTTCISIIAVPVGAEEDAFLSAARSGVAVATLAKDFSVLSSATKGGANGCYTPSSADFSDVIGYVHALALNTVPSTPQAISNGDAYFVVATTRTPNALASIKSSVLAALADGANSKLIAFDQAVLIATSQVSVDPEFGRWDPNSGAVRNLLRPSKSVTPFGGAGVGP